MTPKIIGMKSMLAFFDHLLRIPRFDYPREYELRGILRLVCKDWHDIIDDNYSLGTADDEVWARRLNPITAKYLLKVGVKKLTIGYTTPDSELELIAEHFPASFSTSAAARLVIKKPNIGCRLLKRVNDTVMIYDYVAIAILNYYRKYSILIADKPIDKYKSKVSRLVISSDLPVMRWALFLAAENLEFEKVAWLLSNFRYDRYEKTAAQLLIDLSKRLHYRTNRREWEYGRAKPARQQ